MFRSCHIKSMYIALRGRTVAVRFISDYVIELCVFLCWLSNALAAAPSSMFALFCFPSTMIDYVGYSYCGDVVLTEEGSFGGSNTKVVCCLV